MKELPQNLEAEKALLGSAMLDASVLDDVQGSLWEGDFHSPANRQIYESMLRLRRDGKPIDAVTIASHLGDKIEHIGGPGYLGRLLETVGHASHGEYYAGLVTAKSKLRDIIRISGKAAEDAYQGGESGEIIAEAETGLHGVLERDAGQAVSISEVLVQLLARMDSGESPGIPMGLEKLDELYHLREGNLVVVAGRPSMGKTGFAVNVAVNLAKRGHAVGFISLEMSNLELASRFVACLSRVSGLKIDRKEGISEAERDEVLKAADVFASLPIEIDDDPGLSLSKIAAKARIWRRRKNIELLIVDYLQLIEPDDRRVNREQQVATMSRGLKKLAAQLGIPVMLLAQLNRESEKRPDKKPRLADLRESGAIEQDANLVLLIHRPEVYEQDERPGEADLIVAKNRNGKTGTAVVQFDESTITFRDLAPKWASGWVSKPGDDF